MNTPDALKSGLRSAQRGRICALPSTFIGAFIITEKVLNRSLSRTQPKGFLPCLASIAHAITCASPPWGSQTLEAPL